MRDGKPILTAGEITATIEALVRGTGTTELHDVEITRAICAVEGWKVEASLLEHVRHGTVNLAFKQRGFGALCVLNRRG